MFQKKFVTNTILFALIQNLNLGAQRKQIPALIVVAVP